MRRLRVLSGHPHLGKPNDVIAEVEHAQAYVDAGFAEWVDPTPLVDRSAIPETTSVVGAPEVATPRPAVQRRAALREQR